MNDQRVILVTGGTKGIGKAIAKKFAEHGEQVVITYGWGSVEEDDLIEEFTKDGLHAPYLMQADVINDQDTVNLITEIKNRFGRLDVFISNVSFASLVKTLDDYKEGNLLKSIEYSCWPIVGYTRMIKKLLGSYPKYVLGLSSQGPIRFCGNYDFAALTKALLEELVKYFTRHFHNGEVIFNILRTRPVITDSLLATGGDGWKRFIDKYDPEGTHVELEEIAGVVFMMCSGYMDGIRGQTLTADKGYDFADGLQHLYMLSEKLGL